MSIKSIAKFLKLNKLYYKIKSIPEMPSINKNTDFRELWVKKTLLDLKSGSRILDAGAGEQQYKKYCKHLEYISQDFAQYDGSGNDKGFQMGTWDVRNIDIVSDIINIPEKDESFDYIMCTEVFEHLPQPILAIKEFSRLLKVGGEVIITAPFCSLTHFAPYHYYTGFNKYFYEEIMPQYGFEIVEMVANGNYFDYIQQELKRVPDMSRLYAKKDLGLFSKIIFKRAFNIVSKMSLVDKQSSEIGCYGYHLRAKKIN